MKSGNYEPINKPAYQHSLLSIFARVIINILLFLILVVAALSRLIDFIFKPMGWVLSRVGLNIFFNPITVLCRILAHRILIPASLFKKTNEETQKKELISNKFVPSSSNDTYSKMIGGAPAKVSKLVITLGGNAEYLPEQVAAVIGTELSVENDDYANIKPFSRLALSHSDPVFAAASTVDDKVNDYVSCIKKTLESSEDISELSFYGRSMGGAILTKVLEKINLKRCEGESPFSRLEKCDIVIDRSYESLSKVLRSYDGQFGFLPVASLLLPVLGWELNTKAAIENICKMRHPDDKVTNIYINTANRDQILGSGRLSADTVSSSDKVNIYSQFTNKGHNDIDPEAFSTSEYTHVNGQQKTSMLFNPLLLGDMPQNGQQPISPEVEQSQMDDRPDPDLRQRRSAVVHQDSPQPGKLSRN